MIFMNANKKKLPLYVSNFKEMIESNYLYIDKTEYIYQLVKEKGYYFLSRPRRFGKSLLVSTLKELFSGQKELFKDLWIYTSDYEWKEYPVIHLDFSSIDHNTSQQLANNLEWKLKQIAQEHAIDISRAPSSGSMLVELVTQLSKKNKVIILIDEYDKPILDHIHNLEEAKKQREVLKSFYGTIKGLDPYLRAVFLTGVTRFAKTSVFSGLNNLNDISSKTESAALLGYTQEEISRYFTSYIDEFAPLVGKTAEEIAQELKTWYNGFRFSKEDVKVYNPFSITYCFHDKELSNYWFKSGTPSFLIHLLKQKAENLKDFKNIKIDATGLESFEIDEIPLITLLFQTGYLTISDYDPKTKLFVLNYPNYEVAESFTEYLLAAFTQTKTVDVKQFSINLLDALKAHNFDRFCDLLKTFFAHIPYQLHVKNEHFYHVLMQALFTLLSLDAQSEYSTDKGRADLVLELENEVFVFEFKFDSSAQIALQQIKDRNYYERFLHQGKSIILVGLAFKYVNEKLQLNHTEETIANS